MEWWTLERIKVACVAIVFFSTNLILGAIGYTVLRETNSLQTEKILENRQEIEKQNKRTEVDMDKMELRVRALEIQYIAVSAQLGEIKNSIERMEGNINSIHDILIMRKNK